MLQESLILIGITLAGGAIPLVAKRSERVLHLLVALAAGVFLGMVFLHLLPELSHMEPQAAEAAVHADDGHVHAGDGHAEDSHAGEGSAGGGHAHGAHGQASLLWLFVLIGVLALFVLQNVVLNGHGHAHHGHSDHGRHRTLGYASLVGLSVHAFTAGLGLAAVWRIEQLAEPFFLSIVGHKASGGFSLATVLLLAGLRFRNILLLVGLFAMMTPAGMAVGHLFVEGLDSGGRGLAILTALAAGTFLYVAVGDLLPEVFHNRQDVIPRLALVVVGVAVSWFAHEVIG